MMGELPDATGTRVASLAEFAWPMNASGCAGNEAVIRLAPGAIARDMLVEFLEADRRAAIRLQAAEVAHHGNDVAPEVAALGDPLRRPAVGRLVVHQLDHGVARPVLAQ